MPKIVLTGGGTAGHVTPNLALLPQLVKDGWEIHYIGTKDGIEKQLLQPFSYVTYHAVSAGKMRRYADLKNLTDPFRVIGGIGQAKKILKKVKPDVVFSKGGFVAVPVVIGAWMNKIPVVIHESDITSGLANKIATRFAKKVCVTFPETAAEVGKKAVLTGTPIREELLLGSAQQGFAFCGFAKRQQTILVMGGSLGAVAVNNALRAALPQMDAYNIIHLCGKGNLEGALDNLPNYKQYEYISAELPHLFALADGIVSRAGSNSIHEFLAVQKPALLIPLPLSASRGDQILNAQSFAKQGFAHMLEQEKITPQIFMQEISSLLREKNDIINKIKAYPHSDGTRSVYNILKGYGGIQN